MTYVNSKKYQRVEFLLEDAQYKGLRVLPGTLSENIRRAIDLYLSAIEKEKKKKEPKSIQSPSKKTDGK